MYLYWARTSGILQQEVGNMDESQKHTTSEVAAMAQSDRGLPVWKRALDILVLLITSPAWLPLGCMVALAVRIGSPGPLFFRQERIGYRGRRFVCFKFRTMQVNAEQTSHQQHFNDLVRSAAPMTKLDAANDRRLIPGGNWIRACGLDELPQLINILRGEMSIVGPRPCIPYEYELYQPEHRKRCDAPPGLTGLWQVSGKNRTTFTRMVELDIEYSRNMSILLDLSILLRTAPAVFQQLGDLVAAKRSRNAAKHQPVPVNSNKQIHPQNTTL
jgi:exopolysaccharide production protein ExoY